MIQVPCCKTRVRIYTLWKVEIVFGSLIRDCGTCMKSSWLGLWYVHECMVRLCIFLNSLLYICKSELRKSQYAIKGFYCATAAVGGWRVGPCRKFFKIKIRRIQKMLGITQEPSCCMQIGIKGQPCSQKRWWSQTEGSMLDPNTCNPLQVK